MSEVLSYAALKESHDRLLAENAELKSVVGECQAYFIAGIRKAIRPVNEGYLHMRCDTISDETPATSAALAAIEARGVEKAAVKLYGSGYVFEVLMRHASELREAK